MPLVLETEGPTLDGVEGEISELGGEEKPSWREGRGQPMVPGSTNQAERGQMANSWATALGSSELWDYGLGMACSNTSQVAVERR